MKFILPDRIPQFDFQYQLIASQDYWTSYQHIPLDIVYAHDYVNWKHALANGKWKDYCPVGSLEFCRQCGVNTIPRNIPAQLVKYAVGVVTNDITQRQLDGISKWHVKSADVIKHEANGMYTIEKLPPFENYQAVSWIDHGFEAEFRTFVYNGNIVDLQNYAGDLWTLPDKTTVEHMIYDFEHAPGANVPPAYTLDVGVYCGNTYVIEVHDFFACGTYNFNDHYRFPLMLRDWYNYYRKNLRQYGNT